MTAIYLVCFHSQEPETFHGSRSQYLRVEQAIHDDEWPYDNGDDPSFYVARKGGLLTWGVCRQDLRNAIACGTIVVFFSFTSLPNDQILYRLCAVATVTDKLDHRAVHRKQQFSQFRDLYINTMISPVKAGWRYGEIDRRPSQRHKDWLWRMAHHQGMTHKKFDKKHAVTYRDGWFPDRALVPGELLLANNYVLFSSPPDRAYISSDPPEVAIAMKGQHEKWTNNKLRTITVGTAASRLTSRRDYLRVVNRSGRNVHRQIRFDMATDEASRWRDALIAALKEATERQKKQSTKRVRGVGSAKCS